MTTLHVFPIWGKRIAYYCNDIEVSDLRICRDDDELSEAEEEATGRGASARGVSREENGHANGSDSGSRIAQAAQALEITYTRRSRSGQPADVVRLGEVDDDVESRCVSHLCVSLCFVVCRRVH